MKTLIITGTARTIQQPPDKIGAIGYKVEYNVMLFGQSQERPLIDCITYFKETLRGYDQLQEVCREKYAKYFQTDLFNIISMECITIIN